MLIADIVNAYTQNHGLPTHGLRHFCIMQVVEVMEFFSNNTENFGLCLFKILLGRFSEYCSFLILARLSTINS